MAGDWLFKGANLVHRAAQRLSFGKLGWTGYGMPVLELTTTGRKSGQPRTVLLTTPLQDGDTIVLVGSRGGTDQHPAWVLNIEADPAVQVKLRDGRVRSMRARVASAEERAGLWETITSTHPHYGGYQTKTERELPVVVLEPAG